ncbi:MAG: NADH-quinone oxidoreductase subunit J [Gemmatimonadota bacterium]
MISDFVFLSLGTLAAMGAIAMIASRNPVASLLFLVLTLFSVAGVFVMLDAHFLAAVQVIVYAGAIMVLFLFVIMLLNLGSGATDIRALGGRALALIAGASVLGLVATILRRGTTSDLVRGTGEQTYQLLLESQGAVGAIANPLFRDYLVPFEITSVLLLVALVGAVVLARREDP